MSADTGFVYVVMFALGLAIVVLLTALANTRASTDRLATKVEAIERANRFTRDLYGRDDYDEEGSSFGWLGTLIAVVLIFLFIASLG